ncbi:TetR/AcrR family transcriptional regulator [Actinomycetes bacterium M1A6_2h]
MPRDTGRRAGLSRDAVLSAAREIAAQNGLDNLTIRSLAARLDVAPNAVYGWVDSKAALFDALVDDAFATVASRVVHNSKAVPLERLRDLLIDVFDATMQQPELAPLYLDRVASPGSNTSAIRTAVASLLADAGIDPDQAAIALPVLLVNTLGFGSFMGQTHGAKLLDHRAARDPRVVFTNNVEWLLTGIMNSSTNSEARAVPSQ